VERRPAVEFRRVDLAVSEHFKGEENAGRDLQKQLLIQPDVVTPPYTPKKKAPEETDSVEDSSNRE
jgi:hypothetical protein